MGCYVRGDKNSMGCYVRGDKTAWDHVLSGVANLCGMFCLGCQKGMFCPGMFCPALEQYRSAELASISKQSEFKTSKVLLYTLHVSLSGVT